MKNQDIFTADQIDYLKMVSESGFSETEVKTMVENEDDREHTLDGCFYASESPIHGKGIFSHQDMKNRKFIARTREGKRTDLGRYVNHSKTPNCKVTKEDGCIILEVVEVKENEELTLDYNQSMEVAKLSQEELKAEFLAISNKWLLGVQDEMLKLEQTDCPLVHDFCDNTYARTVFLPGGSFIMGRTHKKECMNFVHTGSAVILIDGELKYINAPDMFVSQPNTKKFGRILSDMTWTTTHSIKKRDIVTDNGVIDIDKTVEKMDKKLLLSYEEERAQIEHEYKRLLCQQ